MYKRNTYPKLKNMLREHKKNIINLNELRGLIMINIGSNEVTIKSSLRIMNETGLLKDIGNYKFEIAR